MRSQPDFSKMELDELYTDQGISDRFEVFNGIIRHVLPTSQNYLETSHNERKEAMQTIDVLSFLKGAKQQGEPLHGRQ